MSDIEEDTYQNGNYDAHEEDGADGVEQDTQQGDETRRKRPAEEDEGGEEDEERMDEDAEGEMDDEEDEDEDEEDEEDIDEGRPKKRTKHRHKKRNAVNRFLDVEAEVDEDEEDEEDEEDYGREGFIEEGAEDEVDDIRRAVDHARLDRREREFDDQDLARIAEDYQKRSKQSAVRYTGDMNEIPQRLLMPSVHDANLWQVRVRPGKERDIVFSLMRKAIDLEYTNKPLSILSAFQRDSLPGMIYVEARSSKQVSEAINGLVGVFPSRGVNLVPIEEMASLLQIKKQDLTVTPGSWVRIKRGKYQGDLAQVMDITENGEEVGLKFIPRIDLNPKDDTTIDGRKRKKLGFGNSAVTMRPPQRFFNYEEVAKVYGRKQVSKRNQVYVFQNDTYKDGFIEKDFKLSALQLENVNPTLDEITRFTRGMDGAENESAVDLTIIAEASRKAAIAVLQPGDHVEVFEGEQTGVDGVVQSVEGDVVTIIANSMELENQRVDVPARSVRKKFKPGDHVKVMTGKNADETGLVVSVEGNIVTFLSDMSMQEVSVFSKDLREAAEVGSGTNIVGNYELHDLVQLDLQTVGVIFKTERDSFRVLDQNGQTRLVQPHQISMRRDSHRAIATDSEGHELRVGDNVKEVDGEGRKGRILHIHQSHFAFLHNRDYNENGGVFVTRARSLASLAPKGNLLKPGTDLSKMNPAMTGGAPGGMAGSAMGRGPRDRLIGLTVAVIKGTYKGHIGTIKDTNGPAARVELHTNNKIITIEQDKLKHRLSDGRLIPLDQVRFGGFGGGSMGPPRTANPYAQNGGRTPAGGGWGGATPGAGWGAPPSRTPNPYNESGKTPAWNVSSRTPNPYAMDGGKTPAWNAATRTPNPYADGSRTPAWNVGSRTPNPYASGGAGASSGWGGATPGRPSESSGGWGSGSGSGGWGGASPSKGGGGWGSSSESWSAPTPAAPSDGWGSAPTPGIPQTPANFATPGAYGATKTPGAYPFTPAATGGTMIESETYEVPKDWLADAALPVKKGIMVQFKGTFGDGGLPAWNNGNYESRIGQVLFVSEGDRTRDISATANLQLEKGEEVAAVPVRYLVPVPPQAKAKAVVLEGKMKGQILHVMEPGVGDRWVCTESWNMFEEIPGDRLVLFKD
ncbi:transcription elongation factor Spt5 [Gloeophyllum trabeum ATCC 11539]|uniref:Transcription elongation factor SPT5 n=1 Tax=Gloeophyllum trabeum (strain ATCC 11539 / FP-39264 / Madison 617) TaxID=670483 RepID=S7REB6_GLOTA|nr:transcription elongation factor Spt5 [Gloeophyllum trabeum ATCC 11539]EPQ50819.1 transcription elongation factor Spt5 [Gloeophyllum trabeum ATCC 11539]